MSEEKINITESPEKKNKRRSLIATLAFHAILAIMFLLMALTSPWPPPAEEGIFINFGTTDQGSGDVAPETTEVTVQQASPQPSAAEVSQQEYETQDVEESVALEDQTSEETEVTEQPTEEETPEETEEEPEPEVDPSSLFTGFQGDKNKKSDEGLDKVKGDAGSEDGDPSAPNYNGTNYGKGNKGVKDDVRGWYLNKIPDIPDESQKTGKVVIKVRVSKNGKVLAAEYQQMGSTTTDRYLINLARKAALQAEFQTYMNSATEKVGTLTFNFKVE